MDSEKVFYSLNVGDIQSVALDELDRELSIEELKILMNVIPERILWYEIITNAIHEEVNNKRA